MDNQRDLENQLLDDMDYTEPDAKKNSPGADPRLAGVQAPLLDDMDAAAPVQKKSQVQYQELTDQQIALLQQQRAEKGQPPYTPEEIAELKAEYIERQRVQAQQQAMQASTQSTEGILLDEDTYTEPEKKPKVVLPEADASALLDAPEPEPDRRMSFNAEDLAAAKKEAAKRAVESMNNPAPASEEDQKKARQQIELLRQQQMADLAQAGFRVSIIATIIGVLSGACMTLFSLRPYPSDYEPSAFFSIAGMIYQIAGIVLVLLSITIVLRVKALRGFTSFLFGAMSALLLIPGCLVLFQKRGGDGFPLTVISFVAAIIGCFAVTFMLSSSEKIDAYYKRKDIMID